MSFINPFFLLGSALISIPIIIHLLNRRKFRIIDWAAMEFLLEAFRERRRRLQVEHLLLLLLRCLIVLMIVFLCARPYFESSFLSSALGGSSTTRILLIDDSASMQASVERVTALQRAVSAAHELVGRLATERPSDSVEIVLASAPEKRYFVADQIGSKAAPARSALGKIKAGFRRANLSDVLTRFEKALLTKEDDDAAKTKVVYLFSDFRRSDWSSNTKAANLLEALIQDGPWVLADAGQAPDTENLTITEVRTDPPIPVAGIRFRHLVRVKNTGTQTRKNVRVTVEMGGARLPAEQISEIAPGATAQVEIRSQLVEDPGWKHLKAKLLDNDKLAADNEYHLAIRVRKGLRVLIVDSDGSALPQEQESYYLERALNPRGRYRSGVLPTVTSPAKFIDITDLSPYDIIVLANSVPDDRRVEMLEQYVKEGGAVVILLGDRIAPSDFNRVMFRDGTGLSPLKIGPATDLLPAGGSQTDPVHFLPTVPGPPLTIFRGSTNPLRRQVHIWRAFRTEVPEKLPAGTQVLCRYTNPDGTAAMATATYGRGRTFLITTPLDLHSNWNDWPKDPSYLVFTQDLITFMTSHQGSPQVRRPGGKLSYRLPQGFGGSVEFMGPDKKPQKAAREIRGDSSGNKEREEHWLSHPAGEQPGINIYRITGGGKERSLWYATNVDPAEGELLRIDKEELRRSLPDTGYEFLTLSEDSSDVSFLVGEKREAWKVLAWLLLALLVLESLMAFSFGRPK